MFDDHLPERQGNIQSDKDSINKDINVDIPDIDLIKPSIEIDNKDKEVQVPIIKRVVDLNTPELKLNAPEIHLKKPNVDGSNIKGNIKQISPEYELVKPVIKDDNKKGFSIKDIIGGNLNKNKDNKPLIKKPKIINKDASGSKKETKGPTIKGGISKDKDKIDVNTSINSINSIHSTELNKPELKGKTIKANDINVIVPTIKSGENVNNKRRIGLVGLITQPVDAELNIDKKELPQFKEVEFEMPEIVQPIPSLEGGIDLKKTKTNVSENEGSVDGRKSHIHVPIIKGGVNKEVIQTSEDNLNVPNLQG